MITNQRLEEFIIYGRESMPMKLELFELAEAYRKSMQLEKKLISILGWLEKKKPEVFKEGLWDVITGN